MAQVSLLFMINNADCAEGQGPPLPVAARTPHFLSLYERCTVHAFYTASDHLPGECVDPVFARRAVPFVPRVPLPTAHGRPTVAYAMWRYLEWAVATDADSDYFVFLSETCCPLWNSKVIVDALAKTGSSWFSKWEGRGGPRSISQVYGPPLAEHAAVSGQQCVLSAADARYVVAHFERAYSSVAADVWGLDESIFITVLRAGGRDMTCHAEGPVLANWEEPCGWSPKQYGRLQSSDMLLLLATDALFFRKASSSALRQLQNPAIARLFLCRDIAWWSMCHEDKGSTHHLFNTLQLVCAFESCSVHT